MNYVVVFLKLVVKVREENALKVGEENVIILHLKHR